MTRLFGCPLIYPIPASARTINSPTTPHPPRSDAHVACAFHMTHRRRWARSHQSLPVTLRDIPPVPVVSPHHPAPSLPLCSPLRLPNGKRHSQHASRHPAPSFLGTHPPTQPETPRKQIPTSNSNSHILRAPLSRVRQPWHRAMHDGPPQPASTVSIMKKRYGYQCCSICLRCSPLLICGAPS